MHNTSIELIMTEANITPLLLNALKLGCHQPDIVLDKKRILWQKTIGYLAGMSSNEQPFFTLLNHGNAYL
jgi:hypothetical protein